MKASSATSAKAETGEPTTPPTGPSSADPPHTPTIAEQFALGGPSDLPDPRTYAYRKDLADIALAGRVIASHYAEPALRRLAVATELLDRPGANGGILTELRAGEPFLMLDDSLGWAWGYGGKDRLTGYVRSDALKR